MLNRLITYTYLNDCRNAVKRLARTQAGNKKMKEMAEEARKEASRKRNQEGQAIRQEKDQNDAANALAEEWGNSTSGTACGATGNREDRGVCTSNLPCLFLLKQLFVIGKLCTKVQLTLMV